MFRKTQFRVFISKYHELSQHKLTEVERRGIYFNDCYLLERNVCTIFYFKKEWHCLLYSSFVAFNNMSLAIHFINVIMVVVNFYVKNSFFEISFRYFLSRIEFVVPGILQLNELICKTTHTSFQNNKYGVENGNRMGFKSLISEIL